MLGWEGCPKCITWQAAETQGDWRTLLQRAVQPTAS
jgi:hypothetical protein